MWSLNYISSKWYFKFDNTVVFFFFLHQKIQPPYFAPGGNDSDINTSVLFWSRGLTSVYSFIQPSPTTLYILALISVSHVKTFSFAINKYFWSTDLKVWPNECKKNYSERSNSSRQESVCSQEVCTEEELKRRKQRPNRFIQHLSVPTVAELWLQS